MTSKEYLSQAFYLNREIKAKERRLEWLQSIAPGPSMKYSEELKGKGDPRHSLVEYAALNVVDLENEVAADIVRLVELVSDIQATIRKIDSSECRLLLEMRYLSFMDWDEIAARLNCTSRNVFYLHKKALSKVKVA